MTLFNSGIRKQEEADKQEMRESVRERMELILNMMTDANGQVQVTTQVFERTTVYTVACPQHFLGQIIGTKGKNIMGLRSVFGAITARLGFRSIIELPFAHESEKPLREGKIEI